MTIQDLIDALSEMNPNLPLYYDDREMGAIRFGEVDIVNLAGFKCNEKYAVPHRSVKDLTEYEENFTRPFAAVFIS